jgi:hypothetical protein
MTPPDQSAPETGWKKPLPERLARPTYWPAMLAFAITVALVGPITNLAVTVVGLLLVLAALIGWIGEILHE